MKKAMVLLLGLLSIPVLAQHKVTLPVDTKASSMKWTGHAEVGPYAPSGTLSFREGRLEFDGDRFLGARLLVDMASMQQANSDLLHHLQSADFFDVAQYPVTLIAIDRYDHGMVFGSLTIRGKTTPFQSPVQVSASGGEFVVSGKVSLDRTRYGIVYNSPSFFSGLGDKAIRNQFDVEFRVIGHGPLPEKFRS